MSRHPDRARENRVRDMARRQGLMLLKSRRRDPRAPDYGRYVLADSDSRDPRDPDIVFGLSDDDVYAATLNEIESGLRSGGLPRLRRELAAERARAAELAEPARRSAAATPDAPLGTPFMPPSPPRSDARSARSDARSDARMPGACPEVPEACPEVPGAMPEAPRNLFHLPRRGARRRHDRPVLYASRAALEPYEDDDEL